MPSFFLNKKLIILLTSLIVLVALVSYSLKQGNRSTWPEQFVRDTVGWFQYLMEKPAQLTAGFFGNISDIANAYQENKKLKESLADYAKVKQENRDLVARNNELKKQLGIADDPNLSDARLSTAMVLNRSYDQWNQLVTIDKGEIDGVVPGMPVMTGDGLIGMTGRTGKFTSEVSLISDNRSVNQISATITDVRANGMIEGYDAKKKVLLLKKIPIKADVKKGQTVTTSGFSGKVPSGIPIGKVASITTDQYGLTKTAEVAPSANLDDLTYVMVVDREAAAPDAGGEGD